MQRVTRLGSAGALAILALCGPAAASCKLDGRQLGAATIEQMRQQPASILLRFPQGGYGMQSAVAQMAAAGPATFAAVRAVFADASAQQSRAIGLGLATAATACESQDAAVTQRIKAGVQGANAALRRAFVMALPEEPAAPAIGRPSRASAPKPLPDTLTPQGTGAGSALPDPFGPIADWH